MWGAEASPQTVAVEPEQQEVRYRRSAPYVRWAVWALAAASALGALLASGRPTGLVVVDALWRMALAVIVTLAASRCRRWPAVWLAGIACAFSGGAALVAAIGSFVLAAVGTFSRLRNRVLGAAIGALAIQALLRLPDRGFHGLATLVVVVAVVPVLYSAYDCAHRSTRRLARRGVVAGLAFVGLAAAGLAAGAALAYPEMARAVDATRAGKAQLQKPEMDAAVAEFDKAASSFRAAKDSLDAPWTQPARLVPLLAQHREAFARASGSGTELARHASEVASIAPYQDLKAAKGTIDVRAVTRMQQPISDFAGVVQATRDDLDDSRSPWLAPPLTDEIDRFATELDEAIPEVELASEALGRAPALFGAGGERQYLVLFTSPAETRFLGGFAGAYGLLTARDGKVTFEDSGNIADLNRQGKGVPRSLPLFDGIEEYQARYRRFFPHRFFQNLTVSPDLRTNAVVARHLYQVVSGRAVDGVIIADPYALAGFLELTGPVEVEGVQGRIDAGNVVDYLLVDQYLVFADDKEARRERLTDIADATFDALTNRDLPGPRRIGQALSSAVAEKHLMVWMFNEADQHLFDRMGAGGRFDPGDHDFISLRTSNGGPNKIDPFLQRKLDYEVAFDPDTGATEARATIELQNAPPLPAPDYVVGNSSGEPPGTNILYLSFYSPLQLVGATRDGLPVATSAQRELGVNVYSLEVRVPPNATVRLDLELVGQLEPGTEYELVASSQPTVNPDELTVTVRSAGRGWSARATGAMAASGNRATWTGTLERDERWLVELVPLP